MLASRLKETAKKFIRLRGDAYNAMVRALKEKPLNQPGFAFADQGQAVRNFKHQREYFYFTCATELLRRSIFGVTANTNGFNDPCAISVDRISSTTLGSAFQLFTNLDAYNPADGYGICKAIDFYEPTLLFVSDIENIPQIGMPCGPDENGWGISAKGKFGLICISSQDDSGNVWCIRTPDPLAVVGTVYNSDIAAQNNGVLGTGQIQIQYRNSSNNLVNALGPSGTPLILPVYNASAASTFKTNTQIKCICVTGIGLVIIDSQSLVWGRADDANIPHFTSGQIKVYKGAPGSEALDSTQTAYTAFNHGPEIVKDEWCFLTPSGDKNCPYYVIQDEYNGMVLGKAHGDIQAPNDVSGGQIDIWGGDPGGEISFSTNVTTRLKSMFGAIPKNSWLIATFLGPDATANHGGWYITAAQRGNIHAGRVNGGNAGKDYAVDSTVKVRIYTGSGANTDSGMDVTCRILYGPVMEKERVQIEWNGDEFIITKGELDGGFEAQVVYDISKGGTGYVFVSGTIPNSQVQVDNITVTSNLGTVKSNKIVNVFRNRGGWRVVSAEC